MAITTTPISPEAFHPYPDSSTNGPYEGTADAGDFFSTLLDIINPLQHIPLVSTLYRELTGDQIEPAARLVGGAVFGGPIGFASATANVLIEQASGDDVLGHALAMFSDDSVDLKSAEGLDQLAQAPSGPDTETLAQQPATEIELAGTEAIIWSGPRALPARAPLGNVVLEQIDKIDSSAVEAAEITTEPAETIPPEWLNPSHSAAQLEQTARATGGLAPPPSARPWVANAMFDALDKYEALARERTGKPSDDNGS